MTLEKLYKIIQDRRQKMPERSYVAALFKAGEDRIIQKIGEEATEVVIAAKNKGGKKIIAEVADLWFHSLVLLVWLGLDTEDIYRELEQRNKLA